MEAQPLRSIPPPHFGKASSDKAWTVMMEEKKGMAKEGSPSIKLGLGIGVDSGQNPVIKHGKPVFTKAQLHELQHQTLIFKYIANGLPVPLCLVIPICKSLASSFGPASGAIHKQYQTFTSQQGFDYRVVMDPEPGRCRRTDGKKWRCSKSVFPSQKYCEQHMHRGRQRSRKHVEPSQFTSDIISSIKSTKDLENSESVSFHLMAPSSSKSAAATTTTTTGTLCDRSNNHIDGSKNSGRTSASISFASIAAESTNATITTPMKRNNSCSNDEGNCSNKDGKGKSSNCISDYSIINRSNGGANVSPGMDFSPKSVLQGRCRRTDGKKWRCKKEVLPNQKYCARHMHRGAKKSVGALQPVGVPFSASASGCLPCTLAIPRKENCATLSTKLSISISTSSQFQINEDRGTTSSTGSDTTITDTTIFGHENERNGVTSSTGKDNT